MDQFYRSGRGLDSGSSELDRILCRPPVPAFFGPALDQPAGAGYVGSMAIDDEVQRNRTRLLAIVSGQVQGVGFRYWAREQAQQLDLHGAAMNQPDGSVKIVAEGTKEAVEDFLARLDSGDSPGLIRNVDATYARATGEFTRFGVG
jgi:acylphosphatase